MLKSSGKRGETSSIIPNDLMQTLYTLAESTDEEQIVALRPQVLEYMANLISRSDWLLNGEKLNAHRNPDNVHSIIESLIDLGNYDDGKLLTFSFVLLNRFFSRTENLFALAEDARILLVPTAASLAEKVYKYMPVIRINFSGVVEEEEYPFVESRLQISSFQT